jgi:outer membrane protein
MKKAAIPAVILAWGLATAALCQEGAPAAQPQPRVAVIDMNQILAESAIGKFYQKSVTERREQLRAHAEKLRGALEKMDEQLNALQQELQTQRAVLSDEAQEQKELELRRKQRERDQSAQDSQEQYQLAENEANRAIEKLNGEFTEKISPYIEAVVRARGVNLLFYRGTVAFTDPSFDISKDVIARADEAERAKPTTTPAAATTPNAPPKKAPAAKR